MFIGHYSVAFAVKKIQPQAPVLPFLIGVQFVDYLFSFLMPLGIEKMNIVPGFTAANSYQLYFMPYTHSLVGTLLWSLVFAAVCIPIFRNKITGGKSVMVFAVLCAVTVFSHYVLDVLVHTPDMPLFSDTGTKLGFGIWNSKLGTIIAETSALAIGALLYLSATRPGETFGSKYGMPIFFAVLLTITVITPFAPPPGSRLEMAGSALFFYTAIAAVGHWLDKKRTARG